jgi:bacillaene synthase trans-acting acyltransferase
MRPHGTSKKVVFCFGGQGSQYHHMASDLLAEDAVFRRWMQEGDAILRDRFGLRVLDAVYDPQMRPSDPFERIAVTHPALFLVQYAIAKSVMAQGLEPDLMLGVSLGEFDAMSLSGMISFEDGLSAVAQLPERLQATCEPGAMIAVIAPAALHAELPQLAQRSEIAGIGSPKTFVLAVPEGEISGVEHILTERRVTFQRLPVPFAFHSRWIEPAVSACRELFARMNVSPGATPCWSSCAEGIVTARTPDPFWRTLREPMSVGSRISELEAQGGAIYVDLSPSGAIAALARQSLSKHNAEGAASRLAPVMSPFGGNVNRVVSVLARVREARSGETS